MNRFNSTFKQKSTKPLKRSKLRLEGVSDTAQTKKRIQALVREIVILRDKGCILRFKRPCGGEIGKEPCYRPTTSLQGQIAPLTAILDS